MKQGSKSILVDASLKIKLNGLDVRKQTGTGSQIHKIQEENTRFSAAVSVTSDYNFSHQYAMITKELDNLSFAVIRGKLTGEKETFPFIQTETRMFLLGEGII